MAMFDDPHTGEEQEEGPSSPDQEPGGGHHQQQPRPLRPPAAPVTQVTLAETHVHLQT